MPTSPDKRYHLVMPADEFAAVSAEAKRRHIPVSMWLRQAIRLYLILSQADEVTVTKDGKTRQVVIL